MEWRRYRSVVFAEIENAGMRAGGRDPGGAPGDGGIGGVDHGTEEHTIADIFYLSALYAYGSFADDWNANATEEGMAARKRNWKAYALAGLWFVMALLAKITAFSFRRWCG